MMSACETEQPTLCARLETVRIASTEIVARSDTCPSRHAGGGSAGVDQLARQRTSRPLLFTVSTAVSLSLGRIDLVSSPGFLAKVKTSLITADFRSVLADLCTREATSQNSRSMGSATRFHRATSRADIARVGIGWSQQLREV